MILACLLLLALAGQSFGQKQNGVEYRGALHPLIENKILPHLTHGANWQTSIILMNVSTDPTAVQIKFFKPNGAATKFQTQDHGNIEEFSEVLKPGASRIIRSIIDPEPTETLYWAEVTEGSGRIQTTAIFTNLSPGIQPVEFTVPNTGARTDRMYFPFDHTNGYGTGVALANAGTTKEEQYRVEARDEDGNVFFTGYLSLKPRHNTTLLLADSFPELGDRKGTIVVSSADNARMNCSPVVMRFTPDWSLTYVPVYDQF